MTKHEYRIDARWAYEVRRNNKRFEIRKDDRSERLHVGDRVDLIMDSGKRIVVEVTYIFYAADFPEALKEGFFIFGFDIINLK